MGKSRKYGELQAAIAPLVAKDPRATPAVIAAQLAISPQNARMALKRFKRNAFKRKHVSVKGGPKPPPARKRAAAKPSPRAKPPTSAVAPLTESEQCFVALVPFIGVERSEQLVAAEKAKIMAVVAAVSRNS